ncbi:hypothetical protein DFH09DRAFT_1413411 [Mycena vulgaris]|nr:hypothetical protein DFH09DRAFT_1413411 [Mycena vulgaris]
MDEVDMVGEYIGLEGHRDFELKQAQSLQVEIPSEETEIWRTPCEPKFENPFQKPHRTQTRGDHPDEETCFRLGTSRRSIASNSGSGETICASLYLQPPSEPHTLERTGHPQNLHQFSREQLRRTLITPIRRGGKIHTAVSGGPGFWRGMPRIGRHVERQVHEPRAQAEDCPAALRRRGISASSGAAVREHERQERRRARVALKNHGQRAEDGERRDARMDACERARGEGDTQGVQVTARRERGLVCQQALDGERATRGELERAQLPRGRATRSTRRAPHGAKLQERDSKFVNRDNACTTAAPSGSKSVERRRIVKDVAYNARKHVQFQALERPAEACAALAAFHVDAGVEVECGENARGREGMESAGDGGDAEESASGEVGEDMEP